MESEEFEIFISAMQKLKGVDFSFYRRNFLIRRINHLINVTKSGNVFNYLGLLKKDNAEYNRFLDNLAINVSEFFRDPDVFEYFRENCLKAVISRKSAQNSRFIRVWSAGCAEGQETYSLAIMFREELGEESSLSVKIWGTDIDRGALEKARRAEYEAKNLKNLDRFMLEKYFTPLEKTANRELSSLTGFTATNGDFFRLKEEVKSMVQFRRLDLINDSPLKYMDVIFCRNVMIYLSQQQQKILFLKFHDALSSKGYLVIGKVESLRDNAREMFVPLAIHKKIFQKKDTKI